MVKFISGVAVSNREGVHHARLRRLGTEGRWNKVHRSFESMDFVPPSLEKPGNAIEIVSC